MLSKEWGLIRQGGGLKKEGELNTEITVVLDGNPVYFMFRQTRLVDKKAVIM